MFHPESTAESGWSVRDPEAFPPESWVPPKQTADFKDGLDSAAHLKKVFPSEAFSRPVTRYDGKQMKRAFSREGIGMIWGHPDMEVLESLVASSLVYKDIFENLKELWILVGELLECLSQPPATLNLERLDRACQGFSKFVQEHFVACKAKSVPEAFSYNWNNYEHIVQEHMYAEAKALKDMGFAPCILSSKYIEATNKFIKAAARRCPGGGKKRQDFSHFPIVQIFKKLSARNKYERLLMYADFKEMLEQDIDFGLNVEDEG